MAFDKKAYNRDYYLRNKEKWEAYRDGNRGGGSRYSGTGRSNTATIKSVYQQIARQRYGAYGNAKAQEMKDKKNREHAINSSNAAIARRKQQEAAQNRYGKSSRNIDAAEYFKDMRRSIDWWESDKNNPALKYDRKKDRYVGKSGLGKKTIADRVKGAGKTYADYWKTGAKSIKSGVTGAAKSYGSAWKTGAKTISKSAEKAKKKAANFIAKLFG